MYSRRHKKQLTRRSFSVVGMFVMAVLLLVISCPLKRVLQSQLPLSSTASSKQVRSTINSYTVASITTNACAGVSEHVALVEAAKEQKLIPSFHLPSGIPATGFAIHHYLSGTERRFSDRQFFLPSSLPLFLQQQRLLI